MNWKWLLSLFHLANCQTFVLDGLESLMHRMSA